MVRKISVIFIVLALMCLFHGRVIEAEEGAEYYQIFCQEPNGNNGYYKMAPQITITHLKENFITRYQISFANGRKLTGRLERKSESKLISAEVLPEGEHLLDIWVEERNGKIISGTEKTKEIWIDESVPDGAIQFVYDKEKNMLEIKGEDNISGVEGIYYKIGGESKQYTKGSYAFVSIPEGFRGKISAQVVDRAGNVGKMYESQEISACATARTGQTIEAEGVTALVDDTGTTRVVETPEITDATGEQEESPVVKHNGLRMEIEGIEDYMITGENIEYVCRVSNHGGLYAIKGEILWEKENGEKERQEITDWEKGEEEYIFRGILNMEGIYNISLKATDNEGNSWEEKRQAIIDKTKPIVTKINELQGARLSLFQWDYDIEQIVSDFTTFTYEARLDGSLCQDGEVYTEEGTHTLEVIVTDAAGNETKATAKFEIIKIEEHSLAEDSRIMRRLILSLMILFVLGVSGIVFLVFL